jgi:outer membrane protein TolC
MRVPVLIALLLHASLLFSQSEGVGDRAVEVFRDSLLSYVEYLDLVKAYHPVAIMAGLETDFAAAELQQARGGFDPTLFGAYDNKQYDEVLYYDAITTDLVIPTWAGVSLQAGFLNSTGTYLNPEFTTPSRGLVNAGITAQVGAGLLMDSRRAALRQAQIGVAQGQVERSLLLNKLYFEATDAYYRWAFAEQALSIAQEAVELATVRYDAVRQSHRFGDVPAIDTVEAYTQVLNRLYKLRQAQTDWVRSVNFAAVYLWNQDYSALMIPPGVLPAALRNELAMIGGPDLPLSITDNHPELQRLQNIRGILDIDRRLAAEFLRPKLEVSYNFLSPNEWEQDEAMWFPEQRFMDNNYTFKATASFPLFLRDARGKLSMTKIKMSMVEQDFFNVKASLDASLNSALVELDNLRDQIGFFNQNVEFLNRLLEGERQLFINGESSLFLVNARESQLIEGQNMYFDLLAKEKVLMAEIRVVGGIGFP